MTNDTMIGRRKMLGLIAAGAGAVALGACDTKKSDSLASGGTTTTTAATDGSPSSSSAVGEIPTETAGPYPADGTNGPNVLTQSGIARSDIRSSFGSYSGTASGVLLDVVLTITDADTGAVLPGKAVYLWHADQQGRYSLYSQGVTNQNFCRGLQAADANGVIHFKTIFPAAYDGRWPHIHFEIFDNASQATTGRNARKTTQLALPQNVCQVVYNESGYETAKSNLAHESLSTDMVFSDGVDKQLATVAGSVAGGYTASLTVGI